MDYFSILNILGIIGFAISGALVAIDEKFDLMGIFILSYVTAFGGGAMRNLLIGAPQTILWEQSNLFVIVLVVIIMLCIFPYIFTDYLKFWIDLSDSIGLVCFAIQAASLAQQYQPSFGATIMAALITAIGGGILRDLLAGRKPIFLYSGLYGTFAFIAGIAVYLGITQNSLATTFFIILLVIGRMLAIKYNLNLPGSRQIRRDHIS
ncbi:MAG: trimeric intracellular cation channel family protein [Bacillus sp. (in: firmicutes)]